MGFSRSLLSALHYIIAVPVYPHPSSMIGFARSLSPTDAPPQKKKVYMSGKHISKSQRRKKQVHRAKHRKW